MPIIPDLFVTPHAVAQFQKRIAPMDAAKARQMILDGIRQSTDVRVLPDGATLRVRARRPFPFEWSLEGPGGAGVSTCTLGRGVARAPLRLRSGQALARVALPRRRSQGMPVG